MAPRLWAASGGRVRRQTTGLSSAPVARETRPIRARFATRRVAVWGHQLGQQISGYPSGSAPAAPAGTTPARAAPALGGGCPLQQGEKARPKSRAEAARPG